MKIAALAPFPFVEAEFGGGQRIHNLLTAVDHEIRVFVANAGVEATAQYKNLKMSFHKVPTTPEANEYDMDVANASKEVFGPLLDLYEPDLVILEHPWQVQSIKDTKFLYDAHNNETHMKTLISSKEVVQKTQELEAKALEANHVTFCSFDDQLETKSPKTWIPNGTELPKATNKDGYKSKMLLFAGSAHPPNIGAALTLAQLAPALPNYEIVIAGSCGQAVQTTAPNVTLTGHVSKETLAYLMRNARAFVNPIAGGSGTSLKVVSSLSYGLPVISSKFGARGYENACLLAKDAQQVLDAIELLASPDEWKQRSAISLSVATDYSWRKIGAQFNEVVMSL